MIHAMTVILSGWLSVIIEGGLLPLVKTQRFTDFAASWWKLLTNQITGHFYCEGLIWN